MVAHLARNVGLRCVLTTNFDRLIEIACEAAGVPVRVVVTHEDFVQVSEPKDGALTLYKLHGSIERPETLIASINDLVRGLDEAKASRVNQLLADHHMLFIGYSGQDFAINADYLMLEQAQQQASGFTWNLRQGESDQMVASLLGLYGDRGAITRSDLPQLLIELGHRARTSPPEPREQADVAADRLDQTLDAWAKGLPERDRRFGLGRLYLYSGLWDTALEIMRVYYRLVLDTGEDRDLAVASYYVAHAYERLHAFERTPSNIISADVLQRLAIAERIFTHLGDSLMLGRTYNTLARYLGQDPERASQAAEFYGRAQDLLVEAGVTTELAELMNDVAEQMPFTRPGDPERALALAERALDLARQVGDLRQMTRAASAVGDILRHLGRLEDSLASQEEAVRWSRVLADPAQVQLVAQRRGTVLLGLSRWDDARAAFTESAELAQRLHLVARETTSVTGLGMAEEELGELDAAADHYGRAVVLALMRRSGIACGNAEVGLARVAARAGRPDETKAHALNALFYCEDAQWPSYTQAVELLHTVTGQLLRSRYGDE